MAKVVLFSSYLKAGDKGHIQDMLDYIGTREGAVLNIQNEKDEIFKPLSKKTEEKEVTKKQKELIDTIMKKYEDMSELPEYDLYMENQNMFTASLFIAESMKLANEFSLNDTVYLKYISERPGAVKNADDVHGLFDMIGPADRERYKNELAEHNGNVWIDVISMLRDDAAEKSFDKKETWESLLRKHMNEKCRLMGIPEDRFRWVAAFHDESFHPHVHVMYWDRTGEDGFQNKEAIKEFKSSLVNDIYNDELWLQKELKSEYRNEMENSVSKKMDKIIKRVSKTANKELTEKLENDLLRLSKMLPDHGSKAYGYQSEEVKQEVNKIVKDVLTSESMYPLVDQYLDSVSEINSYYLKGEEKIKESLLNEYDKMINPAKDGRKVFHNTILKSAFEIKQNEARRYMHIDYRIQGLNCKLQYPGYYQIDDDKVLQAVAKAGILQEKNIDQMIMEIDNIMNVPVTGTDERMERILEIILQAKDHPQLYKADITRLEKAFGENIGDAKKLNAEFEIYQKGSALACAHVINNFISFLSMSKNENEREARRIHNVHARDEHMMRLSKMKERRNQK